MRPFIQNKKLLVLSIIIASWTLLGLLYLRDIDPPIVSDPSSNIETPNLTKLPTQTPHSHNTPTPHTQSPHTQTPQTQPPLTQKPTQTQSITPPPTTKPPTQTNRDKQGPPFPVPKVAIADTPLYNVSGKAPLLTFVVLTADDFKDDRTKTIRETWGKQAEQEGWRVYYYSDTDQGQPKDTIGTHMKDGSGVGNDAKQWAAWLHAQDCCDEPSPFYMKVDDDTYVYVERLKQLLTNFDRKGPRVYGQCEKVPWLEKAFCGGGSGIIMNREGLEFMMSKYQTGYCKDYGHNDLTTSYCFLDNGVNYDHTLNLNPEHPTNWKAMVNGITFHHLKPDELRQMHKVFYNKERT